MHVLPPEVGILQLVAVQRPRDVDVLRADAHHVPQPSRSQGGMRFVRWYWSFGGVGLGLLSSKKGVLENLGKLYSLPPKFLEDHFPCKGTCQVPCLLVGG